MVERDGLGQLYLGESDHVGVKMVLTGYKKEGIRSTATNSGRQCRQVRRAELLLLWFPMLSRAVAGPALSRSLLALAFS